MFRDGCMGEDGHDSTVGFRESRWPSTPADSPVTASCHTFCTWAATNSKYSEADSDRPGGAKVENVYFPLPLTETQTGSHPDGTATDDTDDRADATAAKSAMNWGLLASFTSPTTSSFCPPMEAVTECTIGFERRNLSCRQRGSNDWTKREDSSDSPRRDSTSGTPVSLRFPITFSNRSRAALSGGIPSSSFSSSSASRR
mmetsp:Transcript_19549/g.28927  ORF Transcript_19549/g.28927 Transcript_19549/m.28927 type:complete len:200 (-) Transcript_19549:777-1376(-)